MLVLCDHERAGATLPADLTGVIDQQSGSAHAMLDALVAAPGDRPARADAGHRQDRRRRAGHPAGVPRRGCPTATLADKLRVEPLAGLDDPAAAWSDRGRAATGSAW